MEEAAEVCGRTSGKGRQEKETWWWSDEVQISIKMKKATFKEWQGDRENQEKRHRYKAAKNEAWRSVAEAKEQATKEWY